MSRLPSAFWRLAPAALLWLSLVLMRQQIVADLRLELGAALAGRLYVGWIYDFATVLAVLFAAELARQFRRMAALPVWIVLGFALWLASASNAGHFHFFGIRLDWWIVKLHWQDVGEIGSSIADYAASPLVSLSILSMLAALALPVLSYRLLPAPAPPWPEGLGGLWLRGRPFAAMLLLLVAGFRLPDWLDPDQPSMIVSDQIVRVWWYEATRSRLYAGANTAWMEELSRGRMPHAAGALAALRDYHDGAPPRSADSYGDAYPLVRQLVPDPARTASLRDELGLPREGPIHVVLLLLETVRAFELEHPDIGKHVFPRLRTLFSEHAIYFSQAYTSSFITGQTARAQFSSCCSMLPNILGAAPYLAHNTVRVTCIQELLQRNGWRTTWMSSHKSSFHGSRQFEMLHGTELFYEEAHFLARGVTQRIGNWGLGDGPVLQVVLDSILELAATGAPVFTEALTLSTHHPHSVVAEGPLPPELLRATESDESYRGYLSRLRYADGAVADFLEALFASPIGGSTLVVMLGDHSTSLWSTFPVDAVARLDQQFRVPLAIVTRDMKRPRRVEHPVHQVDVAPSIAEVLGVAGSVTWLGRSLFGDEGTPWVYQAGEALHYRTKSVGCYTLSAESAPTCYDLSRADPLLGGATVVVPEDPALSGLMRDVLRADRQVIALNEIAPP